MDALSPWNFNSRLPFEFVRIHEERNDENESET